MKDISKNYKSSCINLHGVQEEFKLCHLPFLIYQDAFGALALEGSSGTGKTTLVQRIGTLNKEATGGEVAIFSADKARYEDFVGCPIPNKETKEMDMYPMQHAVATKETILIDEINRADYGNQEKWMSLLSSRKIDGFEVACKYIYVAMNPVMSDKNDIYEGVQPLDKAVGERIIALIRMKNFNELNKREQANIMQAAFSQVKWTPTLEAVDMHRDFIKMARDLYAEYKEKYIKNICEYIHIIQDSLKKETQGTTLIEARRAQFLMSNILGVYALNSIYYGKSCLDSSALQALEISFPGRLWEQPVPLTALNQAHKIAKDVLSISAENKTKSTSNFEDLYTSFEEIKKSIEEDSNKENVSKTIHNNLPNIKLDPINHYVYAIAAVTGLSDSKNKQKTMKAQEFDRLKRITDKVKASDSYKKTKEAGVYYKRNKKMPSNYKYPEYIDKDLSDSTLAGFHGSLSFDVGWFTVAIGDLVEVPFKNGIGFMNVAERLAEAQRFFKEVSFKIENPEFEITIN